MSGYLYKVFLLVVMFLIGNNFYAQSNFTVEINKINYTYYSPPVPDGLFTITFTPGAQQTYLNIGATNNSTQQFGIIVQNMLLPSSSETAGPVTFSTTFDFSKICAPPYIIPFTLTVYVHILTSPGFYPFDPSTWKDTKTVTVNQVTDDAKGSEGVAVVPVPITPVVRPGQTVSDPLVNYTYRPDAPNLDLDNSTNGISVTYAGDLNACVPTATANSMKWAQSKYSDINLPPDMDLRKTEQTLSGLMKRLNGEGTYTDKMIAGKLDFIEQFKLPMEVKYQSFEVTNPIGVGSTSGKSIGRSFNPKVAKPKPTWDFLWKMMKNGEDVEMNFTWYDTTTKKWYGHSVNVTGINEYGDGIKKIAYKHDRRQGAAGGLIEEIQQITVDANGWMRFGEHNEYFIKDVVAESPVVQEGRETAAWLNELFSDSPLRKTSSGLVVPQFIEIALKSTVTDLNNYTVILYDGKTGNSYATYTLDQFTAGTTSNGLAIYYMNFPSNNILGSPAGIAISHTGAVIQNQFISYGGSFVAADGDATGLTSTNIGTIPTAYSVQLTGNGTAYSQFSLNYGVPTPGAINQDETYSTNTLTKPAAVSPNDGDKNLSGPVTILWNKVTGAANYELQVSTDPFFLTNVLVDNSTLTDTTYSFANTNLEGSKIYWRVRAIGSNIKSGFSAIRYFTDKLNDPTNLAATSSQSKVNLTWQNNSTNSKGTYIQRKPGDINSTNQFQTVDSVSANSYSDANVQAGTTYTYRVYVYNDYAQSGYSNTQTVSVATSVKNDKIPTEFKLDQNYPNPFNPSTIIGYELPVRSFVNLKIYDLLGHELKTLVSEYQNAGRYSVQLSASNEQWSSGIYFYKLQAGDPSRGLGQSFVQIKKMILIK